MTDSARVAASDPMNSSSSAHGAARIMPSVASADAATDVNDLRDRSQPRARRASRATIHPDASAKSINDGQRGLDIARRGRDLNPLHHARAGRSAISRAMAMPSAAAASGPSARRIRSISASGTRTPGHFVRHELGVARALERENAGDDRQPRRLDALQEPLEARRRRRPAASATNSAPASTL